MTPLDFAYAGLVLLGWPLGLAKVLPARGRRHLHGLPERLGRCARRTGGRPCVWVHCVSVGEARAAVPLVEGLLRRHPGHEVVVSTTTSSGQEAARRAFPGRRIVYFPLDLHFAVRRVFDALRPDLILLVELELWPNFLWEAKRRRVPVAVVNGRIRESSARRYRAVRPALDPLRGLSAVCVQTEEYAARFRGAGLPARRVHVTGSLKYDLLAPGDGARDAAAARAGLGLGPAERVLLGGSTHPGEEEALVAAWRALRARHPDLRLVVCPRHVERADEVARLLGEAAPGVVRRSAQRARVGPPEALPPGYALLVDTVGELGGLYGAADLVFVGGSLVPRGGQNPLEPVVLGRPTVMGPSCENFAEPVERLLAAGGLTVVPGAEGLAGARGALLEDPAAAAAMGDRGRRALETARGATARTLDVLAPWLEPAPGGRRRVR